MARLLHLLVFAFHLTAASLLPLRQVAWHIPSKSLTWLRDPPIVYLNGTEKDRDLEDIFDAVEDLVVEIELRYPGLREVLGERDAEVEFEDTEAQWRGWEGVTYGELIREVRKGGERIPNLNAAAAIGKFQPKLDGFCAGQSAKLDVIVDVEGRRRQEIPFWQRLPFLNPSGLTNSSALALEKTIQGLALCEFYKLTIGILHAQIRAIVWKSDSMQRFNNAFHGFLHEQRMYAEAQDLPDPFMQSQLQLYQAEFAGGIGRQLKAAGVKGGRLQACYYAHEHLADKRWIWRTWEEGQVRGPAAQLRGVQWRVENEEDEEAGMGQVIRRDWGDILDKNEGGKRRGHGNRCQALFTEDTWTRKVDVFA